MNLTTEQRDIQHAVLLSRKDQLKEIEAQFRALKKRKREVEIYIADLTNLISLYVPEKDRRTTVIHDLVSPQKAQDHAEVKCFTCGSSCPLSSSGKYYVCPNYVKNDDAGTAGKQHFLRKVSRN